MEEQNLLNLDFQEQQLTTLPPAVWKHTNIEKLNPESEATK